MIQSLTRTMVLLMVLLLMLAGLLVACGGATPAPEEAEEAAPAEAETSAEAEIMVMEPFARTSIPNGAVYMSLMNQGGSDDALISAETEVAETVEIHETRMDENDVMQMSPVQNIPIPAGGSATLEPGGLHVMLLGVQEDLAVGDTFDLTLNFEQSGSQTIQVEVRQGMGMDHNMEEEDMEGNMEHSMEEGEMEE